MKTSIFIPCTGRHFKYIEPLLDRYISGTVIPDQIVVYVSGMKKPRVFKKLPAEIIYNDLLIEAGPARQMAKLYCGGDIIIYQDADDFPHPQRIEIVKKWFETHDVMHLTHSYVFMGKKRMPEKIIKVKDLGKKWIDKYFLDGNLEDCVSVQRSWGPDHCYQHAGACSIRKEVLDVVRWKSAREIKLATWLPNKAEDYDFCMEVAFKLKKSVMIDSPIYEYRT